MPMLTQTTLSNKRLPERDIMMKLRKTARHAQLKSARLRADACSVGGR